jgi:hypothetical protein
MGHFPNVEPPLLLEEAGFLEHANRWRDEYMGNQKQPNPGMQPTRG